MSGQIETDLDVREKLFSCYRTLREAHVDPFDNKGRSSWVMNRPTFNAICRATTGLTYKLEGGPLDAVEIYSKGPMVVRGKTEHQLMRLPISIDPDLADGEIVLRYEVRA